MLGLYLRHIKTDEFVVRFVFFTFQAGMRGTRQKKVMMLKSKRRISSKQGGGCQTQLPSGPKFNTGTKSLANIDIY